MDDSTLETIEPDASLDAPREGSLEGSLGTPSDETLNAPTLPPEVGDPPPAPPTPATSSAPRPWQRGMAAVLAAVVAGGAAGGAVGRLTAPKSVRTVTVTPALGGRGTGSIANATDIQKVLAAISPAVVAIKTQAFRQGRFFPSEGAGSGTILTADGEILTNAHVVAGATNITVTLNGQSESKPADLIGVDPAADVALIKVRGANGLPVATLGNSKDLRVGDSVVAIGNALDLGATPTVTEGIVSALNRSIEAPGERLTGLIQTDAAINPGNSGGPLVDAQGRVVGMDTAIAGDAQNIGFALPIDQIQPVIERLRRGGSIGATAAPAGRGFLGVNVQDDGNGGVAVAGVVPGSPADKAGIQAGDEITAIDGHNLTSPDDLVATVRQHRPGDAVTVVWTHSGSRHSAKVTLSAPSN